MASKHAAVLISSITLVIISAAVFSQVLPELFVTSDRCMACHNGLFTSRGEDISIGSNWRSSLMAHSSRDPYWQASVRRETLVHPSASAAIQHECAGCHMPMSRFTAKATGGQGQVFAHLPVGMTQSPNSGLAGEGVSCSMCHQIEKDGLGTKESFTAGFVVDTKTLLGQRRVYGPYEIDAGRKSLMRSAGLFEPNRGEHIQTSELCATCHTLYTHALDDQGNVVGELPEQVPYLEWKHSAYYEALNCQTCHMPVVAGQAAISNVVGIQREQVSRHVFRGGNFFMPRILNLHRGDLGVTALAQELETTGRETREHLETSAAKVNIEDLEVEAGTLTAKISISNRAGHKLPSAYPSRRAWVHLTVRDRRGAVVFESGKLNTDGSIAGNDNDTAPNRYEPHYERITRPDEVQIYEGILAAPGDEVTTVLLSAVRYIKDNRILPRGFDKASADEDIAVQGQAFTDETFVGGSDTIVYEIDLQGAAGPFEIEAELWYQPIAYRWAQNLKEQDAAEIDRFVSYYDQLSDLSGIVLGADKVIR